MLKGVRKMSEEQRKKDIIILIVGILILGIIIAISINWENNSSEVSSSVGFATSTITSLDDLPDGNVSVEDFNKLAEGVWVDNNCTASDYSSYDFLLFSNGRCTFGTYCGHVWRDGEVKSAQKRGDSYTLTIYYPEENDIEYYGEILEAYTETWKLKISNKQITTENGNSYTLMGKTYEEASEKLKNQTSSNQNSIDNVYDKLKNTTVQNILNEYGYDFEKWPQNKRASMHYSNIPNYGFYYTTDLPNNEVLLDVLKTDPEPNRYITGYFVEGEGSEAFKGIKIGDSINDILSLSSRILCTTEYDGGSSATTYLSGTEIKWVLNFETKKIIYASVKFYN